MDMTSLNRQFWGLSCSLEVGPHINVLLDSEPRRYHVNFGDYHKAPHFDPKIDDYDEMMKCYWSRRPPIQDYTDEPDAFDENGTLRAKYRCDEYQTTLIIDDPTFIYDHFEQAGTYVSEKFRDTLMLPSNSVEYVSLNDSQCPPEVRAQKYMVMRVLAFRDVIDVTRSDGFSDKHPYMRLPTPHEPLVFAFKDVEVDVPLFFDFRFHRALVTDDFAARVLRTELTGIAFLGHNTVGTRHRAFFKSLVE
jgi:hypothetical protein